MLDYEPLYMLTTRVSPSVSNKSLLFVCLYFGTLVYRIIDAPLCLDGILSAVGTVFQNHI